MDRMGRDSERAAMIYLRGSGALQHEIADSLSKLARQQLNWGSKRSGGRATARRSGTQRARTGNKPREDRYQASETSSDLAILSCAPSRTRTCGLLLRRHNRYVAGWRWAWLHVPFTCTDNRWTVLGVA